MFAGLWKKMDPSYFLLYIAITVVKGRFHLSFGVMDASCTLNDIIGHVDLNKLMYNTMTFNGID